MHNTKMFRIVFRCLIFCFILLCNLSFTIYNNKFNALRKQHLSLESRKQVHVSVNADPLEQFMLLGDNYINQSKDTTYNLNKNVGSTNDIVNLINERAVSRFNQDYDEADRIKEELHQTYGVEIQDSKGMWFSLDGRSGNIKGHSQSSSESITPVMPIRCALSAEYIQQQVELRTQLRRQWKYYDADKIRDELAAAGVELLDQSNEWIAFDGSMRGQQSHDRVVDLLYYYRVRTVHMSHITGSISVTKQSSSELSATVVAAPVMKKTEGDVRHSNNKTEWLGNPFSQS